MLLGYYKRLEEDWKDSVDSFLEPYIGPSGVQKANRELDAWDQAKYKGVAYKNAKLEEPAVAKVMDSANREAGVKAAEEAARNTAKNKLVMGATIAGSAAGAGLGYMGYMWERSKLRKELRNCTTPECKAEVANRMIVARNNAIIGTSLKTAIGGLTANAGAKFIRRNPINIGVLQKIDLPGAYTAGRIGNDISNYIDIMGNNAKRRYNDNIDAKAAAAEDLAAKIAKAKEDVGRWSYKPSRMIKPGDE